MAEVNVFTNQNKTLIIDADSIAFAAALQESNKLQYAIETVKRLQDFTGCKDTELYFTTERNCFRYKVDPTYKSNRKGLISPEGLKEVKIGLNKLYPGELCTEYEADDIVIWRGKQRKTLVAAIDKDVLGQLVGTHFNYHHKHWCYQTTNRKEAKKFLWIQMIQGDTIGCIYGIAGIGKVKARQYLEAVTISYKKAVWQLYRNNGKSKKEFLSNLNLLDMHLLDKEGEIHLWKN